MEPFQQAILLIYGLAGLIGSYQGYKRSRYGKNFLGKVGVFQIYGAFVWADIVVFGLFWFLVSLVTYLLNDWVLFLLTVSLFWLVRSVGETIYWFNQQFSTINRNPAKNYWFYKIFQDEYTVWFVFQIWWQCLTVVAIIFSLYFGKLWLTT